MQFTSSIDFTVLNSTTKPTLLFKHSTRCSISTMALDRVQRKMTDIESAMDVYFIDVISDRQLSNNIAQEYGVTHESPQAILLHNGNVVYSASHNAISADAILSHV